MEEPLLHHIANTVPISSPNRLTWKFYDEKTFESFFGIEDEKAFVVSMATGAFPSLPLAGGVCKFTFIQCNIGTQT